MNVNQTNKNGIYDTMSYIKNIVAPYITLLIITTILTHYPVAWIAERKNLLSTTFFLTTLLISISIIQQIIHGGNCRSKTGEQLYSSSDEKNSVTIITILIFILLAYMTKYQTRYWHDSVTLFKHTLSATRNIGVSHNNLAVELIKRGELNEASYHIGEAIGIKPDYADAYFNPGKLYAIQENIHRPLLHTKWPSPLIHIT